MTERLNLNGGCVVAHTYTHTGTEEFPVISVLDLTNKVVNIEQDLLDTNQHSAFQNTGGF